jgi:hypothetical protein
MTPEWKERRAAYEERSLAARRRWDRFKKLVSRALSRNKRALSELADVIRFGSEEERGMVAEALEYLAPKLPKGRGRHRVDVYEDGHPAKIAEFEAAFFVLWAMQNLRRRDGYRRLRGFESNNRGKDQPMQDQLIDHAIKLVEQEQPELKGRISKNAIESQLSHSRLLSQRGWRIILENDVPLEELPNLAECYELQRASPPKPTS